MEKLTRVGPVVEAGPFTTIYRHPHKAACVVKVFKRRPDLYTRESEILRRLPEHPGICAYLGIVTYNDGTNEYPGLVFPLYRRISPCLLRDPLKALRVVGALAWTLISVHRVGFVHGDLKPENFMLSEEGVVLIDFNLAGEFGRVGSFVGGTSGFMAPEVILKGGVDQRTDIFSLGMVLYEIMGKKNPLEFQYPWQRADIEKTLLYFHEEVASLKEPLNGLINRMTAFKKEDRFQNAAETYLAILKTICLLEKGKR